MPPNQPANPSEAEIYSVSRLNREARRLLESGLGKLWVAGEISNLARPASGHIYFSLKDDKAQVRCAMFRGANRGLSFRPENGTQVLVQAKVSIYEARGDYQLIAEHMEEAGEGLLRRKFEELKGRLDAEGLFDERHKQLLPDLPRTIGIVTSPSGAAIRDILHVLERRFPAASAVVYPTRVQGQGANDEIVAALTTAIQRDECDVLIIARGGGSLEDLWSFNEENVARAIFTCPLPVISGVGHEVDFTIADLVADIRAPTPSGAAELVVPDREELLRIFAGLDRRSALALRQFCGAQGELLRQLAARLNRLHPGAVLDQLRQGADEMIRRLFDSTRDMIAANEAERLQLGLRLRNAAPAEKIARLQERLESRERQLVSEIGRTLDGSKARAAIAAGSLNSVSPLATLERGYAIVRIPETGEVVRDARQLQPGDHLEAQLASGSLDATVDRTAPKKN